MNTAQVYCRTCCPSDIPFAYQRLKYYDLSHPEFEAMWQAQNGLCALCDEALRLGGSTGVNVDHCHISGRVRGLLCHRCNMLLGLLESGTWFNKLQRIANYLAGVPALSER